MQPHSRSLGASRASRSTAAARRREILRAAREVCLEEGTPDVAMDAIAQRARVSKGTLYRHFASKDDLLIALIEEQLGAGSEILASAIGEPADPRVALQRTVDGLLEVIAVQSKGASLVYQSWALARRDPALERRFFAALQGFFDQWRDDARRTVVAGQATGVFPTEANAEGFADAIVSLVSGSIFRAAFDPAAGDPARLRSVFHALVHEQLLPTPHEPDPHEPDASPGDRS